MATATGLPEDVEKLLTCPVCLDVFTKPVVILPCQHNLCRRCAEECYDRRGRVIGLGGKFACPTCRFEVMVDRTGVHSLQRNLLVENIIDMYAAQLAKPKAPEPEPEPVREPTPPPTQHVPICDEHEGERLNIFCLTCQKPTCSMCKVFGKHQGCEVVPITKAYDDHKGELRDHVSRLGKGIELIQSVQIDTERKRSSVEDAGKRAKNEVNQAFQQLCALLEKRKTAMINQIQTDVNEHVGILTDMCTSYKKQREEIQKVMNEAMKLTEEPEPTAFLEKSRTMISKVMNQSRSADVRPPTEIIPEMKQYNVDFQRYHQVCQQIDFVGKGGASPKMSRPDSARSAAARNPIVDPTMIPGLARPPPMPAPMNTSSNQSGSRSQTTNQSAAHDDEMDALREMTEAMKMAESGGV